MTALGNAIWGGGSLGFAYICHKLLVTGTRRGELSETATELLYWGRFPALLVAMHRLFWNVGIWAREEGELYASWVTDHKHYTLILVLGMVYTAYRATRALLPPETRKRYAGALSLWLLLCSSLAIFLA